MAISSELDLSLGQVKQKLHGSFAETIEDFNGILHGTGQAAFEGLLNLTVGHGNTGVEENWRRDHGFLYECTQRIARRALRQARKENTDTVTWEHVAKAANCLIPDISYYCMKEVVAERGFETKGLYCRDFDGIDETPPEE